MELELTELEITNLINATFDSVNLLNILNTKDISNYNAFKLKEHNDTILRNKKHIELMLSYTWFLNAMTIEQKTQLESIIA